MSEPKSKATLYLRLLLLLIVLATVGLLVRKASLKKPEPEPTPEKALPVTILRTAPASLDNLLNLPGTLEPWLDLMIPIEKPGTLVVLAVDRGDRVTQGQLLCRMDDRTWQAALKQAEINDREAQKELKRWDEIHKSGAVSIAEYDLYKTRAETAQIALTNAAIELERCSVTSPADGFINDRFADLGEYVHEGQELFQLLQLDRMKLVILVPERQISPLHLGQALPFQVEALSAHSFTAQVTFIAAKTSGAGNAYRVEAAVENPDALLKAGMIAQVTLPLGKRENVISIPLASLIPDKGEYVVFVRRNGTAERRIVRIAEIRGTQVIIQSGLEPDEDLIVEGHRALADGMPVEVLQTIEQ